MWCPLAMAFPRCASISAPGWRMYFVQRGDTLIVMLGVGDKSTQARDIAAARRLALSLED